MDYGYDEDVVPHALEDEAKYSFAEAARVIEDMQRMIGGLAASGKIDSGCAKELQEMAKSVHGHLSLISERLLNSDASQYSDGRPVSSHLYIKVEDADVETLAPLDSPAGHVFPDAPIGWLTYTWYPQRDNPRDRDRVLTAGDEIPSRMYGCTADAVVAVNTTGRYKVIAAEPGHLATVTVRGLG